MSFFYFFFFLKRLYILLCQQSSNMHDYKLIDYVELLEHFLFKNFLTRNKIESHCRTNHGYNDSITILTYSAQLMKLIFIDCVH